MQNDYVGKGLSGGQITVKADETTRQKSEHDLMYSNQHFNCWKYDSLWSNIGNLLFRRTC